MKKYVLNSVISFITATILAAVIFALSGIYPGSERTLLVFDMLEQFVSFYSSLKSVFSDGGSYIYTFMGSLGTPYLGMFAYYLASPFSLLTLLFDVRKLPDAIWLIDILKCGTIAATFSIFMSYREVKNGIANVTLSLCYALSSAAVSFFLLPMYLDSMYMLPLICIFLETLLRTAPEKSKPPINVGAKFGMRTNEEARSIIQSNFELNNVAKRGIAYSVCLALCMYFHYYSAYMVCIFLIMYSFFILTENMSEKPDYKDMGLRFMNFVFYSIFGALLASPLLLPVLKELAQGKSADSGVYSNGSFIVTSLPGLLKQFVCGHFGSLYSEGAPAIYFTVIVFVIGILGLVKGRKKKANTVCSIAVIALFILSFMFRPLYRVWHMFRDPVAYPHRFAFLFVFFIILLASRVFTRKKDAESETAGDLPLSKIIGRVPARAYLPIGIAGSLVIAALLVFNGYKNTSAVYGEYPDSTRSSYVQLIDMMADIIGYAQDYDASIEREGVSLCRINKDIEITSNDPMLLSFNGMDYFSSSYNSDMLRLYKELGILQYHYKACDRGSNIVTDMILGVDYELYFTKPEYGYEFIYSNGFSSLYRNPYSLGVGYLACDDTCSFGTDPFANQNSFISSVLGKEAAVYETFDYSETEKVIDGVQMYDDDGNYVITPMPLKTLEFAPPIGRNLYLNFELLYESELDYDAKNHTEYISVVLNERGISQFNGYQRASNIYLGNFNEDGDYVLDIYDYGEDRKAYLYSLNPEKLDEVYAEISEGRFIADSVSGGTVIGHIYVTDSDRNDLVFTIPYSVCFKAYVDDVKVITSEYAGALLTIPDLEPGEHTVRIEYNP
jgi:uncharacterized membrane protein YfhO